MKYIVAIDWGSSKATVAVGNRDRRGRLRVLGVASRPMTEGVVAGEITNIEELTRATRQCIDELEQRLGIDITASYAAISGQEISVAEQSYFVPVGGNVIRAEDVTKLHELMNSMSAPNNDIYIFDRIPQNYLIDNREQTRQPVGRFGRRLDTTYKFVYGSNDNVERLKLAFKTLGIKLLGIFTAPQASAAAVLSGEERELGVAMVDMGAMSTDIAIWHDGVMRHLCVVPLGSAAINRDMRSAAIPSNWIEKLKLKYGYAAAALIEKDLEGAEVQVPGATPKQTKTVSVEALAQIIEARLTDIIELLHAELRESGYLSRLTNGLVLTGGSSNLKKIDELLRGKLRLEVRLAGTDSELLSEEYEQEWLKPEYATAMGVLLLGLAESNIEEQGDFEQPAPKPVVSQPAKPEPKPEPPVESARERRQREKEEAARRKESERRAREAERQQQPKEEEEEQPVRDGLLKRLLFKRNIADGGDSFVE